MISKPGIYTDFPTDAYFRDPMPEPSLTQSVAKIMLEQSPLHAWYAHPRLNPDYRHDDDTKFDVGNIAHKMMIGRGKDLIVLPFDDWRKDAAKVAREEAAKQGKLAVLGKKSALADRMVKAAREQLELRGYDDLFRKGDGEVVLAWHEDGPQPIWCRQMVDWLTPDRRTFVDLKTTGESAAPHLLGRKMAADGWHIQAAMAERGLNVLHPQSAGRRRYLFVVQEDYAPHQLNIVELSETALTMGRKQLDAAAKLWRACHAANLWPGYQLDNVVPEFPGWAEQQWLDREIKEAADERKPKNFDPETLMAG